MATIDRKRVMEQAHYMFTKCYGHYKLVEFCTTFSDFLKLAWRKEKERVSALNEAQRLCKEMEREIDAIRMRRAARKAGLIM